MLIVIGQRSLPYNAKGYEPENSASKSSPMDLQGRLVRCVHWARSVVSLFNCDRVCRSGCRLLAVVAPVDAGDHVVHQLIHCIHQRSIRMR